MKNFYLNIALLMLLANCPGQASSQDSIFESDEEPSISNFAGINNVGHDRVIKRRDDDIISRLFRSKEPERSNDSALIRIRVVELGKSSKDSINQQAMNDGAAVISNEARPEVARERDANDLYTQKLSDVSRKLAKLPFNRFNVLSDESITSPVNEKHKINISKDQTLFLKPLYFHDNKLCVWLDWREPDGAQILDSQLHFNLGESIIVGNESSEENGLLLILNAEKQ